MGPQPRVHAVPPALSRDAQGHAGSRSGSAGVLPARDVEVSQRRGGAIMAEAAVRSLLNVLVVYGDIATGTTMARSGLALIEELRTRGFDVVAARTAADAAAAIRADPLIGCVIVDADLDAQDGAKKVLGAFRERNDRAPAFLFGQRSQVPAIPLSTLKLASEFIWLTEDTPVFMA